MVENPKDKFCAVKLHLELLRRYKLVDPKYKGRIFRRAVKRCSRDTNWPNMTKNGVIGKNKFSDFTKHIAHRTGMTKPSKCTSGGRRRAGISQLSNAANHVPEAVRMKSARHKCPTTHALYQETNEEQRAHRYQAHMYDPADFEDDGKSSTTMTSLSLCS
jgi:hypothetical protein